MALHEPARSASPVLRIIANWGGTALGLTGAALLLLRLSAP